MMEEAPVSKQELIQKFVQNYYQQVAIVGTTTMTLEAYLNGIFKGSQGRREEDDDLIEWNEDDLAYGLSLAN